jgi:glycosyltransferase involved in cell wall biosynthesis
MTARRILFIADHRPDRSPGQRFRCEQYFDVLQSHGIACELSYLLSAEADQMFYRPGNYFYKAWIIAKSYVLRWRDWRRRADFDAVFIFRNCLLNGSLLFEKKWAKAGKPIIFDFDDAIWFNDTSAANRWFAWMKRPEKINFTIAHSAVVLAGNAYLRDYALQFNTNVRLMPSTIDCERYGKVPRRAFSGQITIGWSGSITTIKHFESAIPALFELKKKYREQLCFKVIGDPLYTYVPLEIVGQAWSSETEPEDLADIDIGIMPLPDNDWTRGKCGLKGLQYMAMGIPTVMSAVGVNVEIISHGKNGFLASTQEEWTACLSHLIEDQLLRTQMGQAAKQTVEQHYSKQAWSATYVSFFKEALANS